MLPQPIPPTKKEIYNWSWENPWNPKISKDKTLQTMSLPTNVATNNELSPHKQYMMHQSTKSKPLHLSALTFQIPFKEKKKKKEPHNLWSNERILKSSLLINFHLIRSPSSTEGKLAAKKRKKSSTISISQSLGTQIKRTFQLLLPPLLALSTKY